MIINSLPIFCITLEKSPERWERVQKNFLELNQEVIKFVGCDGKLITENDVPPLWKEYHFYGNGICGCAMSHYKLWQHILDNDIEYACVLEDDAEVIKKIESIEAPDDFDVLYISNRVGADSTGKVCSGCGTEGYIVSKKGCEKLLIICEDMSRPVDLRIQAHMRGFIEHKHPLCEGHSSPDNPFHSLKNSKVIIEAYKTTMNYTNHNDHGISYVNQ